MLVALAVVRGFVFLARAGLTLIAIALFLAVALNPAVELFERRGLRREAAVGAVHALAPVAFTLLSLIFIPPLIHQVTKFIDALPSLVAEVTEGERTLGFHERDYHVVERVRAATSGGGSGVAGAAAPVIGAAKELATALRAGCPRRHPDRRRDPGHPRRDAARATRARRPCRAGRLSASRAPVS